MSNDKPTPRRWRVEQETDLIWGACSPDDESSNGMGYPIVKGVRPDAWSKGKPDYDERKANAALIVRSVNSSEAAEKLLKAARRAEKVIGRDYAAGTIGENIFGGLRAAITEYEKAKEARNAS
jgi:hypothetical protein